VVHIAEDPAFSRYPTRGFPVDLAIRADAGVALGELAAALARRPPSGDEALAARRARLAERRGAMRAGWRAQAQVAGAAAHIQPEWISRCLADAVGPDAIIVNEYPLRLEHCEREHQGSFFGLSPAGGLGWGLGAALGIKLHAPDRLVVATLGDGAYMFDNPTACHWVSAVQHLPILVLVFNNQMYGAVRNSTTSMYPQGAAAANSTLLADLSPAPAFEKVVEASGGYGERVDDPGQLAAALARAVDAVTRQGRQALLNIVCRY
jgi:acetolactate synthase-1/2/3 large subunit